MSETKNEKEPICEKCKEPICRHGLCYCNSDGLCRDCERWTQMEYEADREANFQRNVMGPMLGLTPENDS